MRPSRRLKHRIGLATVLGVVLMAPPLAQGQETAASEADLMTRARAIHESVITIDTHDDI